MPCLVYQISWYICAWCGQHKHPWKQQQSCPENPLDKHLGWSGLDPRGFLLFQLVSLHNIMSMHDKFQLWGDHLRKREEVKFWYKLVYLIFFMKRGALGQCHWLFMQRGCQEKVTMEEQSNIAGYWIQKWWTWSVRQKCGDLDKELLGI